MSAPRTKRQFAGAASDPAQRQITSFFANTQSSATSSPFNTSTTYTSRTSQSSSLPASVQSNLISVGMRVRKSVPEGYKTGDYSAFSLWDENDSMANMGNAGPSPEGRSRANAISSPRELLPFCGIHKVGGMDTQPAQTASRSLFSAASIVPTRALYPPSTVSMAALDSIDDVPGLTSSQDSMASTDSNASIASDTPSTKTRKRSFTEEEDDAPETPGRLDPWRDDLYDGEISPRSLAPAGWGNRRVMAVPKKGRLRNKLGALHGAPTGGAGAGLDRLGQENVMIVDNDFDEAEFLDRDRSWEVEMSDV